MPRLRFVAHPERRPAVVAGASSGIGAATAEALAARPATRSCSGRGGWRDATRWRRASRGGRRGARAPPRPGRGGVGGGIRPRRHRDGGAVDIMVSSAGHAEPGTALRTSPKDFARTVEVNLLGAHRLVAALAPAMVERRHGDLVFVSSDILRRPDRRWRPTWRRSGASKGSPGPCSSSSKGTGVRATDRPARPDPDRDGHGLGPRHHRRGAGRVGPVRGLARHSHFLRPPAVAAAVLAAVSTPPGTHLPFIEVQPEAPVIGPDATNTGGTP